LTKVKSQPYWPQNAKAWNSADIRQPQGYVKTTSSEAISLRLAVTGGRRNVTGRQGCRKGSDTSKNLRLSLTFAIPIAAPILFACYTARGAAEGLGAVEKSIEKPADKNTGTGPDSPSDKQRI
jgi:hypothetical protein